MYIIDSYDTQLNPNNICIKPHFDNNQFYIPGYCKIYYDKYQLVYLGFGKVKSISQNSITIDTLCFKDFTATIYDLFNQSQPIINTFYTSNIEFVFRLNEYVSFAYCILLNNSDYSIDFDIVFAHHDCQLKSAIKFYNFFKLLRNKKIVEYVYHPSNYISKYLKELC